MQATRHALSFSSNPFTRLIISFTSRSGVVLLEPFAAVTAGDADITLGSVISFGRGVDPAISDVWDGVPGAAGVVGTACTDTSGVMWVADDCKAEISERKSTHMTIAQRQRIPLISSRRRCVSSSRSALNSSSSPSSHAI